jgi:hypothetical protein
MLILVMLENGALSVLGLIGKFTELRFHSTPAVELITKMILGFDLGLCVIFVFPLFSLIWVQLSNICLNKTTYERYSKAKPKKTIV